MSFHPFIGVPVKFHASLHCEKYFPVTDRMGELRGYVWSTARGIWYGSTVVSGDGAPKRIPAQKNKNAAVDAIVGLSE